MSSHASFTVELWFMVRAQKRSFPLYHMMLFRDGHWWLKSNLGFTGAKEKTEQLRGRVWHHLCSFCSEHKGLKSNFQDSPKLRGSLDSTVRPDVKEKVPWAAQTYTADLLSKAPFMVKRGHDPCHPKVHFNCQMNHTLKLLTSLSIVSETVL